ncbi:MAG: hypothetical protein ACE5JU_23965, partial [Candidatus Binatia bacterium]
PKDVKLSGISWYQRYWPDAILVLIIPGGDFFYAQAVSELDAHQKSQKSFDLTTEFRPLSELFGKIHPEIATLFRADVMRFAEGVNQG